MTPTFNGKKRSHSIRSSFQLPLDKTVYEFTQLKGIPGAVRDAGPDAWGRRVIEHKLERSAADLQEIDYLLRGPQDGAGYLSFGLKAAPPAPKRQYNRTHQLAELIAATQAIEEGRPVAAHVLEQLDPGTSMGGARPKAKIEDAQCLWLGKSPARDDRFNLQRVEFATLNLARRCGLNVTQARLQTVGDRDVLMLQRFDRDYTGKGYLRFREQVRNPQWQRDSFFACGVSAKDIDYIAPAILPECFFFERPPGE